MYQRVSVRSLGWDSDSSLSSSHNEIEVRSTLMILDLCHLPHGSDKILQSKCTIPLDLVHIALHIDT